MRLQTALAILNLPFAGLCAERTTGISLASVTIDVGAPPAVAADLAATPQGPEGRYLVKLPGPVNAARLRALRDGVAAVYCYLPYDAFLVRAPNDRLADLARATDAVFVGPYHPAYKIARRVADLPPSAGATPVIVMVHTFPDADVADVAGKIQALGVGRVVGYGKAPQFGRIRLLVPAAKAAPLASPIARLDDVFWVDVEPPLRLLNDTTIWVGQSGVSGGQTTPVFDHGIYGEGQVVGIIDTGLDADMCYYADTARGLPPTNVCNGATVIDALERKVLAVDFLWNSECSGGIGSGEWDTQGHGTHVAGTVAGDQGTPLLHDSADGMAPGAKLVIQDAGYNPDNCGDLPGIGCPLVDMNPIFQQAYDQGARVHTNSYGDNENAPVQNDYTAATEDVDQFMWDHKDFLIFFAAGNSGPGNDTVGSPSTAKSCISVGATYRGSSAEWVAFFSSCGYTDDGRIKPEITIPGDSIESAADDYDIGTGNCGTTSMSGTSMASPAAAGLAALVREYYTDGFYPTGTKNAADALQPSAALVRATVVNSAQRMTSAGSIPNRCQGWGRILLDNALYFPGDARKLWVDDDAGFPTGSTGKKDFVVSVASGSVPLKATLAWTDYPSTPAAMPHIVNDLDLVVTAPDGTTVYKGNVFSGGQSMTGGSPDRLNTLEQVLLLSPSQTGDYTVTVQAFDVPQGPQPFALSVTGDLVIPPPTVADDFVVGCGHGLPNPNEVKVYTGAGTATAVDFFAYPAIQFGVNVASADIDGGSAAEILTGPGPGAVYGPQVRAFDRAGSPIGKVNFYAYGTLKYGVNVAGGNLDGDPTAEILTGAGPGAVFGPHVRGFNYDNVALMSIAKVNFYAYGTLRYGVNVAAGDIDGDALGEILTGPGPSPAFAPTVRGFDCDGGACTSIAKINFNAYTLLGYGVIVASGDLDADAYDEIVTAPGPGPTNPAQIKGWNYDGSSITLMFGGGGSTGAYGARVGATDVSGDGKDDLLAGAGPDPAASSTVRSYDVNGGTLTLLASFMPFVFTYGVNVAGGPLGY